MWSVHVQAARTQDVRHGPWPFNVLVRLSCNHLILLHDPLGYSARLAPPTLWEDEAELPQQQAALFAVDFPWGRYP